MRKIEILDSLRAFAAISVCLYHFICTTIGYITNDVVLQVFSVGKFGVQLFFVISGFVIPWAMHTGRYKIQNFFRFLVKRLARLEPPYLFSIIIALVILWARVKFLGRSNDHIDISARQVLLHFGYLIPFFEQYQWLNEVYWTLAIEFQYYIVIAILFVPLTLGNFYWRYAVYVLFLALGFFESSSFLMHWLPVFLLGVLLFLKCTGKITELEYYLLTCITLCVCIYLYPIPSVIYSVIPLIAVLYGADYKLPLLHFFGKFSYSIYLIHPLIGASLVNLLSHQYTQPVQKVMVIAAGLTLTLLGSWLMYIFIERPSKNLSASIKYS